MNKIEKALREKCKYNGFTEIDIDTVLIRDICQAIAEDKIITVWKNGTHKCWRNLDATYAIDDPNWLVNIPLERVLEYTKEIKTGG